MFDRAREQLNRAKQAVDALRLSPDERSFLLRFNEAIASSQLVLIALLKEGRGERIPGFDLWYSRAMQRMENDELMTIVRQARDFDFADGPHRLRFAKGPSELRVDEHGRPVSRKSWWTMPADPSAHAMMDNPPRTHQGHDLDRNDPVALSERLVATLERLLEEAGSAVGIAA